MPDDPTSRYARQIILPGIGADGQRKLNAAHAMIVGVGALGCSSADLLVRAGVGRVTLIDRDLVERSNLHRQTLFTDQDATDRRPKAAAAQGRLRAANPDISIHGIVADLNASNAESLIEDGSFGRPDVLVDGTDNYETRFLLNDLSVMSGIPYVYGGAIGTGGMIAVFRPSKTACLRCVFDQLPEPGTEETCSIAGVLAPVSTIIASFQAAETVKLLVGAEDAISTDLLRVDGWKNSTDRLNLSDAKHPQCVCCGQRRYEFLDCPHTPAISLCGRDTVQINAAQAGQRVDLERIQQALSTHGAFTSTQGMIRGKLDAEGYTLTVFADGRALIEGTEDTGLARAVYDRYIGS